MNIIEANQIGDKNSIKKYSKDGFILIKNVYKKTIIKNLKRNFKIQNIINLIIIMK